MNDQELLKYAAAALMAFSNEKLEENWNPLNDDGQAFRLLSRLRIYTEFPDFEACGDEIVARSLEVSGFVALEPLTPDGYRRAVVRVAAEMGKALP